MYKQALIACVLLSVIHARILADPRKLMQKQPTSSGTGSKLVMSSPELERSPQLPIWKTASSKIQLARVSKNIPAKGNSLAVNHWGILLTAEYDLDINESDLIYSELAGNVAEYFGVTYIEIVRGATHLFFDKPYELQSITVWFDSIEESLSGTSKQEPTEYLFKVYPSTGLKGAPYQYFSLYVSGEKDSKGYQYSASIDKKKDSDKIILPGATLEKWLKLITGYDFGVDDNDSIIKELASDKEVASHMGVAGMNPISQKKERMVGGDPKTWGPGNSQVKPVLNKAQSLPLPVVGSLEKKNKN